MNAPNSSETPSRPATFEYLQLEVVRDTSSSLSVLIIGRRGEERFATHAVNLLPFLNELGADGWEVVAVTPSSGLLRGKAAFAKPYGDFDGEERFDERSYLLKRVRR